LIVHLSRILPAFLAASAMAAALHPTYESPEELRPQGKIDELVFAHWGQLGIPPARLSSDAVFVRRAYLDVIGTLPTAKEAADFLASSEPGKRAALIDRLLARDEFADYWAMKWSDLLRVKAEFPINLWPNAAQAYYHWIHTAVRENRPYDRFARDLLTASGSNFRDAPVNFYRAMQNRQPQGIAQSVALAFMGTRLETWPAAQQAEMAALFSRVGYKETGEWKEEIVYFDPAKKGGATVTKFPDGTAVKLAPGQDPREAFANWLTAPGNPWFARAAANRVWYWLMGRGIVQEPDDLRSDNPPENAELLAFLEQQVRESHYDLKQLFRLILTSAVYQLSPIPQGDAALAAQHFAAYPLRRLDAEVLIDTLDQITGTGETYTSAIPEPYTFMPDEQRSIALPDGSIGSAFLELFGRPARDLGTETERNNRANDAQALHMLNSSHVQRKLQQGPKLIALMRDTKDPRELVNQLYLGILSRYPTDEEWKAIQAHGQSGVRGQAAVVDLIWALINGAEFLYRH
jgi:hypothetical protein